MIFQTLDDKLECVGIYADGRLLFDEVPADLSKTWKYTGSINNPAVEYAWIICRGQELLDVCPPHLQDDLTRAQRKFAAYMKAFRIANVNLRDNCLFDLVPEDFLKQFCEIKNQITFHVFENYERPKNYEFLSNAHKLIHKIKYQNLKSNAENCRKLFLQSRDAKKINSILNGAPYIDYNLFGTATGRLSTKPGSFPILTMKKEHRKVLKPHNDWFLSLDYNSAEIRTLIALSGKKQPENDIHEWHANNLFGHIEGISRQKAKTMFFAWLYNPAAKDAGIDFYDRESILSDWYKDGIVKTPMGRDIEVDEKRAFNYLIQSTTADLVLDRAIEIDRMLNDTQSFISHIVHDEIVIDFADSDRHLVKDIKQLFSKNKLDEYMVNLQAGKNYYDLKEINL